METMDVDLKNVEVSDHTRRKILQLHKEMYKKMDKVLDDTKRELLWLVHRDAEEKKKKLLKKS